MVIKTLNLQENPLADYGNIIFGDRFVGRKPEISEIHNRVLGKNSGNISIIGLPRIGKSSLAWQALLTERKKYKNNKIFIIRIDVGEFNNSINLFSFLVDCVKEELFENVDETLKLKLEKTISKINDQNTSNHEKMGSIQKFFKIVQLNAFKIIIVLDEFDHIKTFFKIEDFQFLRELSIHPETRVVFVTLSRRTIQEIELENGSISTLAGVFSNLFLTPFNSDDLFDYWNVLKILGVETESEYRDQVIKYTGAHPFLMDLFNYEIINKLLIDPKYDLSLIVDSVVSGLKLSLLNNYDNILTLLEEEKLLDKTFQILLGPTFNLDQKSIERLLRFGILKHDKESDKYHCFSKFFLDYLNLKQTEFDIWPLWNEAERSLRDLIKNFLTIEYGDNWIEAYTKKHPEKVSNLKKLEDNQAKNIKSFGIRASINLVDYTYPMDMFDIFISEDWNYFKNILGDQKKDWKERFLLLAKIRNPIAHSNSYFITETDYNTAIGICNLILKKINEGKNIL